MTTPFGLAVNYQNLDVMKLMIEKGVEINTVPYWSYIDELVGKVLIEGTPVITSILRGDLRSRKNCINKNCIKLLLIRGVLLDNKPSGTFANEAFKCNQAEVGKWLIIAGDNADVYDRFDQIQIREALMSVRN